MPHAVLPGPSDSTALVEVLAYGYGTFLGRVAGRQARINPGDNPGFQTLLAYLPEADLDVAVLCNEDEPGVDAVLAELALI